MYLRSRGAAARGAAAGARALDDDPDDDPDDPEDPVADISEYTALQFLQECRHHLQKSQSEPAKRDAIRALDDRIEDLIEVIDERCGTILQSQQFDGITVFNNARVLKLLDIIRDRDVGQPNFRDLVWACTYFKLAVMKNVQDMDNDMSTD
jgi:hypothetical protein